MKATWHWLVVLFILLAIFLGYAYGNEEIRTVSLGVLGSLVASAIYSLSNHYFEAPLDNQVQSLKESERSLVSLYQYVQNREGFGVTTVQQKYNAGPDFWFSALDSAQSHVDLMGNCLSGWLGNDYRTTFKKSLTSALQRGVNIRIIILNPYSDLCTQKANVFGKKYKDECIKFVAVIKEVCKEVQSTEIIGSLELRGSSNRTITYMSIINDKFAYISPYMASKKTMTPLVMRLERKSLFYIGYRDDFDDTFNDCATLVSLISPEASAQKVTSPLIVNA